MCWRCLGICFDKLAHPMNAFDFFKSIGSLQILFFGIAVLYALVNGGWLLPLRFAQAVVQFMQGLLGNPHQAVVDADEKPAGHLVGLPDLLKLWDNFDRLTLPIFILGTDLVRSSRHHELNRTSR
jgi:hypothetical protein